MKELYIIKKAFLTNPAFVYLLLFIIIPNFGAFFESQTAKFVFLIIGLFSYSICSYLVGYELGKYESENKELGA